MKQSQIEEIVNDRFEALEKTALGKITTALNKSTGNALSSKQNDIAVLYQLWGNYANAQHTLLSAYIMAHAFIFLAIITSFIAFSDKLDATWRVQGALFSLTFLLCIVGIVLSVQMHYAWHRSRTIVLLIEAHLRQVEGSDKVDGLINFFTNKQTVFGDLKGKKKWYISDADNKPTLCSAQPDGKDAFFQVPKEMRNIDKCWAPRAKLLPALFGIFYVVTAGMSIFLLHHFWTI